MISFITLFLGHFRQFDYGSRRNLEVYGSSKPPDYKLDRISAPMALFSSPNDWLATPKVN